MYYFFLYYLKAYISNNDNKLISNNFIYKYIPNLSKIDLVLIFEYYHKLYVTACI